MDSHNSSYPAAGVQERIASTLVRARQRDRTLHAFIELDTTGAMQRAAELDALPMHARGPLHGMPMAIKEVIDVAGLHCAWGSPIHAGRMPAVNAPLVQRLIDAGAVPVGITASTEYALAAAARTVHPRDALRSPGASSSGSAAAVSAGLVPFALGTQTIGSIIRPAAYCGVVGFKPSFGRYTTDGFLCLSSRLDHAGLVAASVADAIAVDRVLAAAAEDARHECPPLTLRVLQPWFDDEVSTAVSSSLERCYSRLRSEGFALDPLVVDPETAATENELTDTLLTYELAKRHGATLRAAPPDKVSAKLMTLLARGEGIGAAAFDDAVARQAELSARLNAMLLPGEIALAPATLDVAPWLTEGSGSRAPQRLWTLAGLPALTLPVGERDGLPIGVQLVGRFGEDQAVLRAAAQIESILGQRADE